MQAALCNGAVSGSEMAAQPDLEEPFAAAPGVGCRRDAGSSRGLAASALIRAGQFGFQMWKPIPAAVAAKSKINGVK
jgi:hypothetical protein